MSGRFARRFAAGFLTYFPRKFGRVGIELMVDEAIAWLERKALRTRDQKRRR